MKRVSSLFSHYFLFLLVLLLTFCFSMKMMIFDEMEEKYDYHEDKKIDDAFMPRKFIDVEKNP
ncbi:Uncharacterised protein [Staphylococcus aureus]|nr:Uncharacterised protein [Staphylococcus aureus]